jgi:diketogulonate reductase-like aldo/keto reductase
MVVTAYTPLGLSPTAPFYSDPLFTSLATKYQTTVAQILLAWAIQRETVPIPKSSNEQRATQNITVGFHLEKCLGAYSDLLVS